MSGANYVLIINFSVAASFATVFIFISQYDTGFRSARWFATSYLLGMVILLTGIISSFQVYLQLLYTVGFASFLLAIFAAVIGVSRRYATTPPWMMLTLLFIASVIVNFTGFDLPQDSLLRQYGYFAPLAAGNFLVGWVVLKHGRHNFIDRAISVVVTICALTLLMRPLLALLSSGGTIGLPLNIDATYLAHSRIAGRVCSNVAGLLFILAYVQDILRWRRDDGCLDRLTGLLLLSAFAAHMRTLIEKLRRRGRVGALLVLNIDRLDHINSTYGYDAGDEVIVAFANVAKSQMSVDHLSGRVCGDAFGIFMPGSSQEGALEFAETLRVTLFNAGGKLYDGADRPSVSMGLVMLTDGMDFETALARAKAAVLVAKRGGRNRLHLADENDGTQSDTGRQFRAVE